MPSPRNQRRTDRPRRGEGGSGGCCFPRSTILLRQRQPVCLPERSPDASPRRRVLCFPAPPNAAGSENNLTAPPPGGGSGSLNAVPPSPGESRRRPLPAPGALPLLQSGEPAAQPPTGGMKAPRSRRQAAPGLRVPAGVRAAAASSQTLHPRQAPAGSGTSQPGAPGASPSQGVAPGHCRQGCSHLRSGLCGRRLRSRSGDKRTCARSPSRRRRVPRREDEDGDGLCPGDCRVCACICRDRNPSE